MARVEGSYNDAFADDLSLVLPEPSGACVELAALAALVSVGWRARNDGVTAA